MKLLRITRKQQRKRTLNREVVEHEDGSMSITSPWASFKDDDGPKF